MGIYHFMCIFLAFKHIVNVFQTYFQFLEPNVEALICFLDIFESNVGCP